MLIIPALVLIIFDLAVLTAPEILARLVGIVLIAVGIAMLMFAWFMQKFAKRS